MPSSAWAPNGWRRFRLKDVAQLQPGLAISPRLPRDPVVRPYLRVANVQDGHLALADVKTIAVDRTDVARYELRPGDVLMTEGGDFDKLGRGTVWRGEIPGCLHQNHVFAVRPDRSQLLSEFLAAWTASPEGRRYFLSCAKQTTNLASINASQVRAAPLALPPVKYQGRIVEIIAAWERVGAIVWSLLAAKRRFKRGLMQQLLTGKRRLKRFRKAPWPIHPLRELTTESVVRNGVGLPISRVMGVNKGIGLIPMKEGLAAASLDRYMVVKRGWFAYNPMRVNIGSIAMWRGDEDALVSPDYVVFSCDERRLLPRYLDFFTDTHAWESFVRDAGNGSVRVRIWFQDLGQLRILLPTLEEQEAVASMLDALTREIRSLEALGVALARQKRGLMQKLLTGEIRVKA